MAARPERIPASVDLQQRMAAVLATPETPQAPTTDPGSAMADPFAAIAADAHAASTTASTDIPAAAAPTEPPATEGAPEAAAGGTPSPAAAPSPADAVAAPSPQPTAATPPASPADAVLTPPPTAPVPAPAAAPAADTEPAAPAAPATPADAVAPPPGYEALDIEEAPGAKATVFVPQGVGETIKRGYLRQADYTRKTQALGRYRDFLAPLLEPGPQGRAAMDDLAPMMDRALRDANFGQRVVELYARAQQGRPMTFADEVQQQPQQYAQQPQQQPGAQPVPQGGSLAEALPEDLRQDPFVGPVIAAADARMALLEQRLATVSGGWEQQQAQQRAATEYQQRVAQTANTARRTLAATYPDEYGGQDADRNLTELWNYANQYGFVANAGGDPVAGMLAAKAYSDRARQQFQPQPQQSSVAARSIAQQQALAQQAAQQVAGVVAPPNGAAVTSGTPAPVPVKPVLRDNDGKRLTPREAITRTLAAATANG